MTTQVALQTGGDQNPLQNIQDILDRDVTTPLPQDKRSQEARIQELMQQNSKLEERLDRQKQKNLQLQGQVGALEKKLFETEHAMAKMKETLEYLQATPLDPSYHEPYPQEPAPSDGYPISRGPHLRGQQSGPFPSEMFPGDQYPQGPRPQASSRGPIRNGPPIPVNPPQKKNRLKSGAVCCLSRVAYPCLKGSLRLFGKALWYIFKKAFCPSAGDVVKNIADN